MLFIDPSGHHNTDIKVQLFLNRSSTMLNNVFKACYVRAWVYVYYVFVSVIVFYADIGSHGSVPTYLPQRERNRSDFC